MFKNISYLVPTPPGLAWIIILSQRAVNMLSIIY